METGYLWKDLIDAKYDPSPRAVPIQCKYHSERSPWFNISKYCDEFINQIEWKLCGEDTLFWYHK